MGNSPLKTHKSAGFNLSRWALNHRPLTRYLMVVLILFGFLSYFQLGQDEDPPFTFRVMVIKTLWPGATTLQMADQVTQKIEHTLQEVPGIEKISSFSKPGESNIILEVAGSMPASAIPHTWYTIRKMLGDMSYQLPKGVQGPLFNDDYGDVYGVIYGLQSDGFSDADVKSAADNVRQDLLRVPYVNKVAFFGEQNEQVDIEISQGKLALYGLNIQQVAAQLRQQNTMVDGGYLQTAHDKLRAQVSGQFKSIESIKNMPIIGANGVQIHLGDIARVTKGYVDPPSPKVLFQGHHVLAIGISMVKGGDVIAMGKALKTEVAKIQSELPVGLRLVQIQNQPKDVADSVDEFVKALFEAIVIVLAVSFVSLGLHKKMNGQRPWYRRYYVDIRPGLVVAITIPLVLAITFLGMYFSDIGLHKVSLGSLIIALGLLVDDAIIAVEMMVRKLEEGYDKESAATFAYEVTAMPMLTGTLITAVGFLPIGIAKSTTGEYCFAIFAVTTLALVVSWLVSVYFVPFLGTWLLKVKPEARESKQDDLYETPFYVRFRKMVNLCMRHRWKTTVVTLVMFALGVIGMRYVPQQFFPESTRLEVLVDIWYPEGTSMAFNEATTRRITERVQGLTDVNNVTTFIGEGAPRFYLPLLTLFPQTNVSQLVIMPKTAEGREVLRQKLPDLLSAEFPEARIRVKVLPNGPPIDYPVQFRVDGPDPVVLRQLANQVKAVMFKNPDARGVNDNWNEPIKTLHFDVDQSKARAMGVSSESIANAIKMTYSGAIVGQYLEGDKLIPIEVRQSLSVRKEISDLSKVYVQTVSGKTIPLLQVAHPYFAWEPGIMWRYNGQYAITVQSDIPENIQPSTVSNALKQNMVVLEKEWHEQGINGYHIAVAGTEAESSKGMTSILAGMPLMLFVIFTLLMLQLHSFSKAILVFLTGPLGIIGVSASLLISDRPFGFVAMLGVIALMGMIQRNSVILIEQIELDRKAGVPAWEAIVEAAVRRLRPIILTAAAAVLAMIPLSFSVFWGPMALAIMGGLIVATVLTLLSLPALYVLFFRIKS